MHKILKVMFGMLFNHTSVIKWLFPMVIHILSLGDLIYFEAAAKGISACKNGDHNKHFLTTCLKIWTYSVLLKASVDSINTRKTLQKLIL